MIANDSLRAAVRRGRAILAATRDSLPGHVGNGLRCTSCHPDDGLRPDAIPWYGVAARFPQYSARGGRVITLEDRINGCFTRSMNGTPLAPADPAMRAIVAYLTFISTGVPVGSAVPGQGLPHLAVTRGDSARGAAVVAAHCARCHGAEGEGGVGPPLWGARSYNIGAGMARVRTAAAFIRQAMPYDRPGTLTEQQAMDAAVFVNRQPRPDLPGKEYDWPGGNPPPDAAYPTLAAERKADSALRGPRPPTRNGNSSGE